MVNGCMDGAALGMAKDNHELRAKVSCGIFYASKLVIIDDVAGYADGKEVTDGGVKNPLRYHAGIGAGNDDGIRLLPILGKMLQYFRGDVGLERVNGYVQGVSLF